MAPKKRGRPRKFAGPLKPGTTSIKGLNKTEKKQTKAIVKNAIKKEHTLKYFDSDNTATASAPNTSTVGSALKQVSVLGSAQPLTQMTKMRHRNMAPKT